MMVGIGLIGWRSFGGEKDGGEIHEHFTVPIINMLFCWIFSITMETQGNISTTCILLDFHFFKKHLVSPGCPCRLVPYDVMKRWIPRSCNLTSKPDVPWWQKPNISKSYVFPEGTPKSSIYYLGIPWFPTCFFPFFLVPLKKRAGFLCVHWEGKPFDL